MIMSEKITCPMCKKGEMQQVDKKIIADTEYIILKCSKCNHQVARSQG